MSTPKKIYLSSPHLGGREATLVADAFASNWIAPLGPHVDAFEREFCEATGAGHAAALSSGTAALHLALQLVGVEQGSEVLVSTLTFAASANPVRYLGATPTFVDSEAGSWNMDPALLAEALRDRARAGRLPSAVVVVHLYGQSADMDPILAVCAEYGVPLIEDAAEALGATYRGRTPGTMGVAGIYSFNGNKIITTSGGGMLVSPDAALVGDARKLASQAREPFPHYEHAHVGYNYRLSNVLAAIGRGQLEVLGDRVAARRRVFDTYAAALNDLPGLTFQPEADWGTHSRWLTCLTIDPAAFGADREAVRLALEAQNIEARPVWKPMHRQPVFADSASVGGGVADELFALGLCLPSGSALEPHELDRVIETVRAACPAAAGSRRMPPADVASREVRTIDAPAALTPHPSTDGTASTSPAPSQSVIAFSSPGPKPDAALVVSEAASPTVQRHIRTPAAALPRITATPSSIPPVPLPGALIERRRALVIGLHLALFPIVFGLAFLLRFDLEVPEQYSKAFVTTVPLLVLLRFGSFQAYGLFSGWWRHTGVYDLMALVRASTASTLLFVLLVYLFGGASEVPRSVFLIDWGLMILAGGGVRLAVRMLRESVHASAAAEGRRALIVGAGDDAARLLRELRRDPSGADLHPVGMVDDDVASWGRHIGGVPVLGAVADIKAVIDEHRIGMLIVAAPTASRDDVRRLVDVCSGSGIEIKVLPSLTELVDSKSRLSQLRTVAIEDLLGRQPVQMDLTAVDAIVRGRTVLVTGGAGSIGSELARQIATYAPTRLVLLDKAESPLYFVDMELRQAHPDLEIVPVIGDVTSRATVADVFERYRPDAVFHAAAYKHVPLMEANVGQAVRNNVLGTLMVAECAAEYGAERFVLISTDKAVHPSSVMGATKRIAELLLMGLPSLRSSRTEFRAVRFGNVLGSDGSVVPVFKRQIAAGGPITITHPDVTRYFMTIPEAVELVLQAAALPEAAGCISMLEMGEPVRIVELAENLIRLSGLEPYTEVPIVFTGLRPGEKLFEDLNYELERSVPTTVQKIRVMQSDETCAPDAVTSGLDTLMDSLSVGSTDMMLDAIRALVPESVAPLRNRRSAISSAIPQAAEPMAALVT